MIAGVEITGRESFAGGVAFGEAGSYEMLTGVAEGVIDPAHPANQVIGDLRFVATDGKPVRYRTDVCVLRPIDPARANRRLVYEVNNRGRKRLFPHLCGGADSNCPASLDELGTALPLRLGFTLVWSGWDPGAPRADGGLAMDSPIATQGERPLVREVRDEFVSGSRRGVLERFRLTYPAASLDPTLASLRARPRRDAAPVEIAWAYEDSRTIRLLPLGTLPALGWIYDFVYPATASPVLGLGFAATRDWVSHLRHDAGGTDLLGFRPTHAIGFGISQAGRYLRDHLALGFNRDEAGRRVFDGLHIHIAGIGRVFANEAFAQPGRTRTWHEDHDFPEIARPFQTGELMRGDDSDPLVIETNTASEYWQKGASLLHASEDGTADVAPHPKVRGYFLAGTQHGGQPAMKPKSLPLDQPSNRHDPSPVTRALFVALDEWITTGRPPPPSRLPRVDDGTLVTLSAFRFPPIPGTRRPKLVNDAAPLGDWVHPTQGEAALALVPQVDADGNELAGVRLPDIAVPRATHTGWNLYRPPMPDGELADRDGMMIPFAVTASDRLAAGDPRLSLAERYADHAQYVAEVSACVARLQEDRLLLAEDAAALRGKAADR